ncbi:MAG: gluconokinase [Bacteroidota bacterium]
MIVYVMGVSGTGKSTIGTLLADQLGIPFLDGDDFHPASNVSKMSQGTPLTDEDRTPWLQNIASATRKEVGGVVVACSALKQSYRDLLAHGQERLVRWIFLTGEPEIIEERMNRRTEHFMPPGLLASQLDTLEPPTDAIHIQIDASPEAMIQEILRVLS